MKQATFRLLSTPAVVSLAALCGAAAAQGQNAASTARYQVRFERTWSSQTHPQDFPLLAHFSPVIGVTHGKDFELFGKGSTATPGIEKLCEEGKHQPLDAEIQAALAAGTVGALIETPDPIRSAPGEATAEFQIDARHPMVSIAAMIAPSPDWCAVAPDVVLFENGSFVPQKTVSLYAWDTGTDSATSYRALDADQQPRTPMQPSDSPYFNRDGAPTPVGKVSFVRQ